MLKMGMLGSAGLSLAEFLQLSEAGEVQSPRSQAAIMIELTGGPSHLESFDPKPKADADARGEYQAIQTNVPGLEICEHLPRLAKLADLFTVVRGITHNLADHRLGRDYVLTGNRPQQALQFPGFGSVVSRELKVPEDVLPFIAIPTTKQRSGYLGSRYSAVDTLTRPKSANAISLRGFSFKSPDALLELKRRRSLKSELDNAFSGFEKQNDLLSSLDQFSRQAFEIISSDRTRKALDLGKEPSEILDNFGKSEFDYSCLLATRLVEAGTRFVTIEYGDWDTHSDIFNNLKNESLPNLDSGLAGLFKTLKDKGLYESTAVYVTGEFGRTPKINKTGGRDHWPKAMFSILAGGAFKAGQVVGATDQNGAAPTEMEMSPADMAATFYHVLGIDSKKEYQTPTGRTLKIVRNGSVIPELIS